MMPPTGHLGSFVAWRPARGIALFALFGPFLTLVGVTPAARAQRPARGPAAEFTEEFSRWGERFFQQLFGDSPDQRRQLARVPVSRREEIRWGRRYLEAYRQALDRQGVRVDSQGRDASYVKRLLADLQPHTDPAARYPRLQVMVADWELTDARVFPGGTIIVTSGLLDFVRSEAALVGVLAHELSHLHREHLLDGIRRMKVAEHSLTAGAKSPREMMDSGRLLISLFARPFRPEQEAEADLDAAQWTFQAGYEPMELARMFLRLQERDQERPFPFASFLRSHPFPGDRYEAVRARCHELLRQNPEARLYVGRENLRQRTPRSQNLFPD
jgi:predicted Zn-dependent protease